MGDDPMMAVIHGARPGRHVLPEGPRRGLRHVGREAPPTSPRSGSVPRGNATELGRLAMKRAGITVPIVMQLFVTVAVFVGILLTARPGHAQPRMSGAVFVDGLVALKGQSVPADSSAFRFRRVQLTAEQALDTTFAVLAQFEVDDGELSSRGKSVAFLKQAWLRW